MPTNQSSPWGGRKLHTCSSADSPTATPSVSTQAKTVVTTKVPFSQTSLELTRRNNQVKTLPSDVASSAFSLRQTAVAPNVASTCDNNNGNKTDTQSQSTAVLDMSPNLPQQVKGMQSQSQSPERGLKEAGSILAQTSVPSSIPQKESQIGFNVQLTGTLQNCLSRQTCPPSNGLATSRPLIATGDELLGVESLTHQDLFKGQPSQRPTKLTVSISAELFLKLSRDPLLQKRAATNDYRL